MKDKKAKLTSSERLAARTEGFFSRNYRLLIIILVLVIVAIIGIWVGTSLAHKSDESTANAVYQLEEDYNALLLMDDTTSEYAQAASQFVSDGEALIAELGDSAEYAALKTNYLMGLYYAYIEDWASAQSCFETVATQGSGTYFGSLGLANAAAAAENNGDQALALQYYNQIWDDYGTEAPESPKALFNAARIYEQTGDTELAIATYSQLADEFLSSEYAQLASARLIVLE